MNELNVEVLDAAGTVLDIVKLIYRKGGAV
jgi:hypothetical protein